MRKPRKETFCVLVRNVFYRLEMNVALIICCATNCLKTKTVKENKYLVSHNFWGSRTVPQLGCSCSDLARGYNEVVGWTWSHEDSEESASRPSHMAAGRRLHSVPCCWDSPQSCLWPGSWLPHNKWWKRERMRNDIVSHLPYSIHYKQFTESSLYWREGNLTSKDDYQWTCEHIFKTTTGLKGKVKFR